MRQLRMVSSESILWKETVAVGCDGTVINTGENSSGVWFESSLEKRLNHPFSVDHMPVTVVP